MLAQLSAYAPFPAVGFAVFSVVWLVVTAFWLWMLVDCLTRKRVAGNEKLVWVVVLLFSHVVGAVLYFVLVRTRRPGGNLPPGGP